METPLPPPRPPQSGIYDVGKAGDFWSVLPEVYVFIVRILTFDEFISVVVVLILVFSMWQNLVLVFLMTVANFVFIIN